MNILFVNNIIVSRGGGSRLLFQTKEMLEKNGHKVFLLGEEKSKETFTSFFRRWFSIKYYFKTKEIIKKNNIDIVHINGCSTLISPSPILAAKRMNKKVVMTINIFGYYCPRTWSVDNNYKFCNKGYGFSCIFCNNPTWKSGVLNFPYLFIKFIKVGFHRYIIRKYVDHFVCPSRQLRDSMQKTFKLPNEKISHISNFVPTVNHEKKTIEKKENQFLFVGRLSKEKGVNVAIKSINILVNKKGFKDVVLKIIGSGKEEQNLKNMVKDLSLENNVKFLGRIDNNKLFRYYQESIAVLMPSLCLEAFGMVNIESMQNKTPVIASDIGGILDIIDHEENGYLFRAGNYEDMSRYMQKIYGNVELSRKLGEKGFVKVEEEFSENKYYNALLGIYLNKI